MIDTSKLPYWASEYVKHIYQNRPNVYDELVESGELESTALSIQQSASAAYDKQIAFHKSDGANDTTAEMLADSDVMRTYICLPPEDDEVDPLDTAETWEEFVKLRDS